MVQKLKILCSAMDSQGHVNAILGFAKILEHRGHKVIMALAPGWRSTIEKHNFEFIPLKLNKNDQNEASSGNEVKDDTKREEEKSNENDSNTTDLKPENELSATESNTKEKKTEPPNQQLIALIQKQIADFRVRPMDAVRNSAHKIPMWFGWYEAMFAFDDALQEVMDEIKPDMIVLDFMLRLPCLEKTSIPWAQLWSCNPIMLYKNVPPATTGFPTDSPKELWEEYIAYRDEGSKPIVDFINKWLTSRGVPPYGKGEQIPIGASKWLNFYTYPSFLDYNDIAPRPEKWVRMDATVREPDDPTPFVVPEKLAGKPGKLIYFSLGSMGSVDLELMNRVISVCAKSPHRFIVSKGPLHEQIELPDNMWGEAYVNQIAILPHVDLVITHGGNNTLTESLYFGKPVIVMPIFWDQLDNAQRAQEKGIGKRIDTYHFQESDLLDAIEKLLNDEPLKEKLASISATLKSSNSKEMVCELIEKTVALGKSPFDDEKVDQAKSE